MTAAHHAVERHEPLVTLATPTGRGAIATILVQGPQVVTDVTRFFEPLSKRTLDSYADHEIVFGKWSVQDASGEDLVLCQREPNLLEIHCHGGNIASTTIIDSLIGAGYRHVPWAQWLQINESDVLTREVTEALCRATTARTAGILMDQQRGALRHAVLSAIHDLETGNHAPAQARLKSLTATFRFGAHLTRPWHVSLIGEPNVGKSSLINSILGFKRSIVHHEPGTTRDLVRGLTAIDGWPVTLTDTAGLRPSLDDIESQGIVYAREAAQSADLALVIFDGSQPWDDRAREFVAQVANHVDSLLVFNKADLVPDTSNSDRAPNQRPDGVWTSARLNAGIDLLLDQIRNRLIPDPPAVGEAVVFTSNQFDLLNTAIGSIENNEAEAALVLLRREIVAKNAPKHLI